jgi:hypothetical protein
MKTLRRIFSSWHGLLAGLIALVIYLALPPIVRAYDPTAGVFDAGYLVWVGLATFLAFWSVFVGWVIWQLAFASLDRATSDHRSEWGRLQEWLEYIPPAHRWYIVQVTFVLCVVLFLVCLKLVPMS